MAVDLYSEELVYLSQHRCPLLETVINKLSFKRLTRGRRGRGRIVVGFATTYAISAYLSPLML